MRGTIRINRIDYPVEVTGSTRCYYYIEYLCAAPPGRCMGDRVRVAKRHVAVERTSDGDPQ